VARRLTGLFVMVGFVVAACAEPAPPTLATDTVTTGIAAAVWPADPLVITDVACPDLDERLIAQTSRCTAQLHGEALTIDVVVDQLGQTSAALREPLFDIAAASDAIRDRLMADLGLSADSVSVRCDRTVVVALAGVVVGCVAERGADPIEFELRVLDDTGQWTLVYVG
jgi:hypothetical protein